MKLFEVAVYNLVSQNLLGMEMAKRSESRTNPDFLRLFFMAMKDQYPPGVHFRRGSIPFRPVRRIGSEFLGKRYVSLKEALDFFTFA